MVEGGSAHPVVVDSDTSYNSCPREERTAREPAHCQHWTVFVFAVAIKNYHNVNFPSWLDCGVWSVCGPPGGY